jgi:hypothetical protein
MRFALLLCCAVLLVSCADDAPFVAPGACDVDFIPSLRQHDYAQAMSDLDSGKAIDADFVPVPFNFNLQECLADMNTTSQCYQMDSCWLTEAIRTGSSSLCSRMPETVSYKVPLGPLPNGLSSEQMAAVYDEWRKDPPNATAYREGCLFEIALHKRIRSDSRICERLSDFQQQLCYKQSAIYNGSIRSGEYCLNEVDDFAIMHCLLNTVESVNDPELCEQFFLPDSYAFSNTYDDVDQCYRQIGHLQDNNATCLKILNPETREFCLRDFLNEQNRG